VKWQGRRDCVLLDSTLTLDSRQNGVSRAYCMPPLVWGIGTACCESWCCSSRCRRVSHVTNKSRWRHHFPPLLSSVGRHAEVDLTQALLESDIRRWRARSRQREPRKRWARDRGEESGKRWTSRGQAEGCASGTVRWRDKVKWAFAPDKMIGRKTGETVVDWWNEKTAAAFR
jgi:hypothetical protein